MAVLKVMCEAEGFASVKTYIASGNVVFASKLSEAQVKAALEARLTDYAGKPVSVIMRTAAEIADVLAASPFPKAKPNRTIAVFLNKAPPKDALKHASGQNGEEMKLGAREIYIHYGDSMVDSKLKIPVAKLGTARNMNTVAKLAEMAAEL